jgi:DNA-binding NarL/FixJ family response regulator
MQASPEAAPEKSHRQGEAPPRARVLIVDDHPLVREGLSAQISAQGDMTVCGEAADVDEALALLGSTKPTLIIIDLTLKTGHGLDLIRKVRQRDTQTRETKMLVLTAHEDVIFAERALRAGAHGFVSKQEAQSEVIDAIRSVLGGERYLSDEITRKLVGRAIEPQPEPAGIERLSNRELEIFQLIGRGESTRSIAEQLHLSVHTVETHRENIRGKLNLRNGAQLVQRAVKWVLEKGG